MSEELKLDAKAVLIKFEGGKLILRVDTDKDGEAAVDLTINLGEVGSEAMKAFFNKKEEIKEAE